MIEAPRVSAASRAMRAVLPFVLVAITAAMLWRGLDFYRLSIADRVEHADYRVLGPGGFVGHGYGIVGTALIILNLAYLVRRLLARFPLGSMRVWLDMHVATDLAGGLLVLFHSAFQFRTPIAFVSSAAVGVVVITGIVGRLLHVLVPRADQTAIVAAIEALECTAPGTRARVREAMHATSPARLDSESGILRVLLQLPRWGWQWQRRRVLVRRTLNAALDELCDPAMRPMSEAVARDLVSLGGGEITGVAAATLLRGWRGLHRLLAILMVLTVPAHVVVAWMYGYRWIWSD